MDNLWLHECPWGELVAQQVRMQSYVAVELVDGGLYWVP